VVLWRKILEKSGSFLTGIPSNTDGFVEKEFRLITISCLIKLAEGWHWSEEGRGEVVSSWRS